NCEKACSQKTPIGCFLSGVAVLLYPHQPDLPFAETLDLMAARIPAIIDVNLVSNRKLIVHPGHRVIPRAGLMVAVKKWHAVALPILAIMTPNQHRITDAVGRAARIARQIIAKHLQQTD